MSDDNFFSALLILISPFESVEFIFVTIKYPAIIIAIIIITAKTFLLSTFYRTVARCSNF